MFEDLAMRTDAPILGDPPRAVRFSMESACAYLVNWPDRTGSARAGPLRGDGGIRTPDTVARILDFESSAFSQTRPRLRNQRQVNERASARQDPFTPCALTPFEGTSSGEHSRCGLSRKQGLPRSYGGRKRPSKAACGLTRSHAVSPGRCAPAAFPPVRLAVGSSWRNSRPGRLR